MNPWAQAPPLVADMWSDFFTQERMTTIATALITIVAGVVLGTLLGRLAERAMKRRFAQQQAILARRGVTYAVVILAIISGLGRLGVDLSVLVGAAGILTVAIGFASQTSASNLISGIFLLAEKPFVIGDVIRVGQTVGRVTAIDVMSVKLTTFENLFVRIPNETLLKSEITNLTHYPVRRVDILVGVAYDSDLGTVKAALESVAEADPRVLDEPEPEVRFTDFADSAIQVQFVMWTTRKKYSEVAFSVRRAVAKGLDEAGITIPFPQRVVHRAPGAEEDDS